MINMLYIFINRKISSIRIAIQSHSFTSIGSAINFSFHDRFNMDAHRAGDEVPGGGLVAGLRHCLGHIHWQSDSGAGSAADRAARPDIGGPRQTDHVYLRSRRRHGHILTHQGTMTLILYWRRMYPTVLNFLS